MHVQDVLFFLWIPETLAIITTALKLCAFLSNDWMLYAVSTLPGIYKCILLNDSWSNADH